jgi:hypothetical protein
MHAVFERNLISRWSKGIADKMKQLRRLRTTVSSKKIRDRTPQRALLFQYAFLPSSCFSFFLTSAGVLPFAVVLGRSGTACSVVLRYPGFLLLLVPLSHALLAISNRSK